MSVCDLTGKKNSIYMGIIGTAHSASYFTD